MASIDIQVIRLSKGERMESLEGAEDFWAAECDDGTRGVMVIARNVSGHGSMKVWGSKAPECSERTNRSWAWIQRETGNQSIVSTLRLLLKLYTLCRNGALDVFQFLKSCINKYL